MPHDATRKLLLDVIDCGEAIASYIEGRTVEQFHDDRMLRAATEREFITIGEALRAALRIEPELETRIDDVSHIIAFRNLLTHSYSRVNPDAVWALTQRELKTLLRQSRAALEP